MKNNKIINQRIKKYLPLTPDKILHQRREELLEQIQEDGTYLPKSILHADLDRGMLDFVRDELGISVNGKNIKNIDQRIFKTVQPCSVRLKALSKTIFIKSFISSVLPANCAIPLNFPNRMRRGGARKPCHHHFCF